MAFANRRICVALSVLTAVLYGAPAQDLHKSNRPRSSKPVAAKPAKAAPAKPWDPDANAEKFAKLAARLWSLQPLRRVEAPTNGPTSANPIDAFVSAIHRQKGLKPAPPADKLTLLRRVYLDLIGLPPTPEEQDAFLQDEAPNAYEKVVDKLLANEQHGVRWARHWLDVLRYADLDDNMPAASGIYLWRDWVISGLNRDIPYDEFVRAQLLGRRSKQHTTITDTGQRIRVNGNTEDMFALGFLARGALDKENKNHDLALSAVETVSTAFMGMTVGCAKCHDHMFDPIRQKDFYSMKALFDSLVVRKVVLATPAEIFANGREMEEYNRRRAPLDEAVNNLIGPWKTRLYDERVSMLTADVQAIIRKPEKERTPAEQKIADDYYPVLRIDPSKLKEAMPPEEAARYDALRKEIAALKRPADLASYWTVDEDPLRLNEKTYILTSGDPNRPEKDKPVEPGFPFQPADVRFTEGRREAFVDWLTGPSNPLLSRVAVNRIWQWHFGEGLKQSPNDFGALGGRPSHPELLDYLASELQSHGYSMKWLHKLIVTSDTYRMSSKIEAEHFAANQKIDPENRYLWRFRLKRLEAEPLWDMIHYTSGNLDLSVGGKSFQLRPPDEKKNPFAPRSSNFDPRKNRRGIYMVRGYIPSTDI
ncbi:MAG TPA: DUF1549 and DUF1553 domain-containing protein, partial [Bryobacteraceae bacterium]|nr:DUF1549 and DUF1553 domain-containing protein [Bryobacteraceae bacterium]